MDESGYGARARGRVKVVAYWCHRARKKMDPSAASRHPELSRSPVASCTPSKLVPCGAPRHLASRRCAWKSCILSAVESTCTRTSSSHACECSRREAEVLVHVDSTA